MSLRNLVAAAVVLVACVSAAPAAAQRKPAAAADPKLVEAKRLFEEGAASYAKGNYEAAINDWQMAYDIAKRPLIFESLANAYERLGDVKRSREYLAKWRAAAPKDEWELLDARLANLDARVKREEELEKQKKASEERARRDQDTETRARIAAETPRPEGAPLPAYVLAGVGAAAVGIGVTLDIIAAIRRPDAASACATASDGATVCRASDAGAIRASNTFATAGDITWIAGGVVAAGGVVWILTKRAPVAPKRDAAFVAPSVSPRFAGIMAGARF